LLGGRREDNSGAGTVDPGAFANPYFFVMAAVKPNRSSVDADDANPVNIPFIT